MTTQAIQAYGGVAFSREALEMAAASLNAGDVPMHADHDQSQRVRVQNLRAWVDDGTEGFYRLRLTYEIHPDDAHYVANRRGMSAAMRVPVEGREDSGEGVATVELSADHAWFGDEALLQAEALIISGGLEASHIRTERVYQFSFVPDPQIFVTIVLPLVGTIAAGALGSALWDAVKTLFRQRRTPPNGDPQTPTRVNLRLEDGDRSLTGIVETEDANVANRAIDAFDTLARDFMPAASPQNSVGPAESGRLLVWDASASAWLPHAAAHGYKPRPPTSPGE